MTTKSPWGPSPRLRGPQAKGRAYERKFGKSLRRFATGPFSGAQVFSQQWFEFCETADDSERDQSSLHGYAQTDHIVKLKDRVILVENKLTYREEGWWQLTGLYSPLIKKIWNLPQVLVQVVRNLGGTDWRRDQGIWGYSVLDDFSSLGERSLLSNDEPPRFLHHWLGIID